MLLLFGQAFFLNKKMKSLGCEYDRCVVETQLCKLPDTSDTLIFSKSKKKKSPETNRFIFLCRWHTVLPIVVESG